MIKAVLFDLDGTLIDTAPDMGGALNNLLIEEGYQPLPLDTIRPLVSKGGLVLTQLGFADKVPAAEIEPLRLRFLEHYRSIIADQSVLFEGMAEVLLQLENWKLPWGIVTNKPEWLTIPLLEQLDLQERCKVMIGGDTLAKKKPDPLPLLTAARALSVDPEQCIYIGDDERDVIAGKAAGMITVAAAYGYIEPHVDIEDWNADASVKSALQILQLAELKHHDTNAA